jgi:hypothetical protein
MIEWSNTYLNLFALAQGLLRPLAPQARTQQWGDVVGDGLRCAQVRFRVIGLLVGHLEEADGLALEEDRRGDVPADADVTLGDVGGRFVREDGPLLPEGTRPRAVTPCSPWKSDRLLGHLALVRDLPGHGRHQPIAVLIEVSEDSERAAGSVEDDPQHLVEHLVVGRRGEDGGDAGLEGQRLMLPFALGDDGRQDQRGHGGAGDIELHGDHGVQLALESRPDRDRR